MKKYAWIIMLAILVVPICSNAENLIQNGGFEYAMFGWYPIDYLGNSIAIKDNVSTGVAIEGRKNLSVSIINADPIDTWKTSVKYPIPVIVYPGEYVFSFVVTKFSQNAEISGGVMDDTPPWNSYQWTDVLDLSAVPIGGPTEMSFLVTIPYDAWNLAVALNLGGAVQSLVIDKVRLELKSEIVPLSETVISGSVINATIYGYTKLYVVLYPEGDAPWNDVNTVIVKIPDVPKNTTKSWSAVIPSGRKYTIELYTQSGNVYKRITRPWSWSLTANSASISGVDFQIICNYYKTSTTPWSKLNDVCYK